MGAPLEAQKSHRTAPVYQGWGQSGSASGSCTSSLRVIPPPSKSAKMVLHHTTMRGHDHDSTPCLLPTRDSGTSLALCYATLRLAKPKRSVTTAIGATGTPS